MKKVQEKKKKQVKKKLGMGLSSLLSKDEGLAAVIKTKIQTSVNNGEGSKKVPSLDLIKNSVSKKIAGAKKH